MGNPWNKIRVQWPNYPELPFFVTGLSKVPLGGSVGLFQKSSGQKDRYVSPNGRVEPRLWVQPRSKTHSLISNFFSNKVAASFAVDPNFIPEAGRVTRKFDDSSDERAWQAEQILKSFGVWPPQEGETFAIQIDQDNPPPLPKRPPRSKRFIDGVPSPEEAAWSQALTQLKEYLLDYTGETVLFQAVKVGEKIRLVELNREGPFASASHPGQLSAGNIVSCVGGACGIPWLRNGIYPYHTHNYGYVFNPTEQKNMRAARDQNGDGLIDKEESISSEKSYGIGINIHLGFKGSPKSIGCQTLPPDDFKQFVEIIDGLGQKTFNYVLVRRPNEVSGENSW